MLKEKKYRVACSKFFMVAILINLPVMNINSQTLAGFLPRKIDNYKAAKKDNYYNQETLFGYINGGAELFNSYDLKEVISRRYKQAGQPDIVAEIFDMGQAKNAFGVFSHDRRKPDYSFGQGSESYEGAILFWKDRYYVSVVTDKENEITKKAVESIAVSIDNKINTLGKLPEITGWVPPGDIVPGSIFYFHHYIWLNAFFYISNDNFLGINSSTDAVLAKYGPPVQRYYLLLVKYQTSDDADKAYRSFIINYAPELETTDAVLLEDGKWTGCRKEKDLLICVFNAGNKEDAERLIIESSSRYNSIIKKRQKPIQ